MKVEQRPCPSCGTDTDFTVTPGLRGEEIVQLKGTPHKAPCGRPCAASRDVSIREALAGTAHHRTKCECLKEDRGYPRPAQP